MDEKEACDLTLCPSGERRAEIFVLGLERAAIRQRQTRYGEAPVAVEIPEQCLPSAHRSPSTHWRYRLPSNLPQSRFCRPECADRALRRADDVPLPSRY